MLSDGADEALALVGGVSRETRDRLDVFVDLLRRWQKIKNLVGPATLDQVWGRHVADSLQLWSLACSGGRWIDFGSGAGFPGLVIAIVMAEHSAGEVHLVEANLRKVAFLREVIRATDARAYIHAVRAETVSDSTLPAIDVVTARAFAPLVDLCRYAKAFVDKGAIALFPKGQDIESELTKATRCWKLKFERFASRTEPAASILRVHGIEPLPQSASRGSP